MKKLLPVLCHFVLQLSIFSLPVFSQIPVTQEERMVWWQDARFGMFIHWGPVSLKGTEIGWSRGSQVPVEEYDNLYKKFNPGNFNADEWVSIAKEAGMKYIILTTKHHDGFCLWNTRQTDYNIMNSPLHRDVVKELAAACNRQGMRFGTYYSTCDWHHPDFPLTSPGGGVRREKSNLEAYTVYLKRQVAELLVNYGPLGVLWFDVPQEFDSIRGAGVIDLARSLQPDIIINNRSGAPGDFDTPEQRVGKMQMDRPWETCMTIGDQWAWKPNERVKSLGECLHTLILSAAGDGNLLFNVGPDAEGKIETDQVNRLKEMGDWLKKNGESIYGTRGGPYLPGHNFASTRKGNSIYLPVFNWKGNKLVIPSLPAKVTEVRLLNGEPLGYKELNGTMEFTVPLLHRDSVSTVIKLVLDREVMGIPLIDPLDDFIATASNTYRNQSWYSPSMLVDNSTNELSRWTTDDTVRQAWIRIDLRKPRTIDQVIIYEALGTRIQKFTVECQKDNEWVQVAEGTSVGEKRVCRFRKLVTGCVKINIINSWGGPTISEVEIHEID
ncbi:MAG: alpha-L-fucosidase [Bacteroidales bacterium]